MAENRVNGLVFFPQKYVSLLLNNGQNPSLVFEKECKFATFELCYKFLNNP